jgi:hypothetical protein
LGVKITSVQQKFNYLNKNGFLVTIATKITYESLICLKRDQKDDTITIGEEFCSAWNFLGLFSNINCSAAKLEYTFNYKVIMPIIMCNCLVIVSVSDIPTDDWISTKNTLIDSS